MLRPSEKLGRGCGYGFNITNDWSKPLVLFAYDTQGAAEAARAQIKLAIEEAMTYLRPDFRSSVQWFTPIVQREADRGGEDATQ
jgi:hypothetical protein